MNPFIRSVTFYLTVFSLGVPVAMSNDKKDPEFKKPPAAELKQKLTPEQYHCTQEEGTERPFQNAYWDNHRDGLYVDIVSKEPLFLSLDKFDSGSGWPSFSKPVDQRSVKTKQDTKLGMERTEVRSQRADSHLGHLFDDGPMPTKKRYCINSAALKFIPLEDLAKEGFGSFLFYFATPKHWEIATLAGGCFWGVEELLRNQTGVIETQVGYVGGSTKDARYEEVKTGRTGHAEAVQVLFDPKKTSYEALLLYFFKIHDPTTLDQQGNDIGSQYRSSIFYMSKQQKQQAEKTIAKVSASGKWKKPIVTRVVEAGPFWRAEDYHQKYLVKNPQGYTCHYVRPLEF